MRLSTPWMEFDREALNAPMVDDSLLMTAALKRKLELENHLDVELDESVVKDMIDSAKRRRGDLSTQIKYIRRFLVE